MKQKRFLQSGVSAILSGVAALLFALVAWGHFHDGDRSKGLIFLCVALGQLFACLGNIKRCRKESLAEKTERNKGKEIDLDAAETEKDP